MYLMGYTDRMREIRRTEEFSDWLRALRDGRGKAKILVRIERLAGGNPGDVRPVGEGVSEMRINFGPGYRVYYVQRGIRYILLLAGGDKNTQERDIKLAKRLASEHKE
jgi:putative addiction module killer protein